MTVEVKCLICRRALKRHGPAYCVGIARDYPAECCCILRDHLEGNTVSRSTKQALVCGNRVLIWARHVCDQRFVFNFVAFQAPL